MKIKVKQGSIHINSIGYLAKYDDAFVLECDARAKHYEVYGIGYNSDGSHEVVLRRARATLRAEDTDDSTFIEFHTDGNWLIEAFTSRYTTYIYAVREDPAALGRECLWTAGDGKEVEESEAQDAIDSEPITGRKGQAIFMADGA
jgi:hypothetical protein